jgi:tetratricopeptide (TPR) repeat protein
MTALRVLMVMVSLSGAESVKPHIKAALAAYEAGKVAEHEKRFQEAMDSFNRAIEIEPTFLEAYERLIKVNLDAGQRVEAAACITRFLEIQPTAVRYRNTLGTILLERKQTERALAQFSLVLQRDPFNADGLLGFATAARQSGMEDRAADAIERGKKHYPLDERFKSVPSVRPK